MMYGNDEMVEIMAENCSEIFSVDLDYEFDASRFFDFTRPESDSEARVSEGWFRSAPTDPPSPFIVKLKWREDLYCENVKASLKSSASNVVESTTSTSKNSGCDIDPNAVDDNREGLKYNRETIQNTPKKKSEGKPSLTRCSTLMNPTASRLAKIKTASEIYSSRSVGRSPRSANGFSETSSRSTLSAHLDATKRQKPDIGYLSKVARLKHQNLLLHKLSKVPSFVANTVNSRPKPTIPIEPDLETARRAQKHRSRNSPETDANAKLKPSLSKEQPVNKKILKTSPSPPQKKSERQPPVFQRSDNQNSESTTMDGVTNIQRLKNEDAHKQEKCEAAKRNEVRNLSKQKLKHPAENRSSSSPPTELFKKLSLKSEVDSNAASRSKQLANKKVPKETVPGSLRREVSVL